MEILIFVSLALCAVAYLAWQVSKKIAPSPEPKTEVQVLIERANKLLAERGHVLNDSVKVKDDADFVIKRSGGFDNDRCADIYSGRHRFSRSDE